MKQAAFIRWMQRIGNPGLLFLLTLCTLLNSGGFLMAYWRLMHLQHNEQTETLRELRKFHRVLLTDLRKLVNQSSVQATEDLCQVRFRLREENGWGYPMEEFVLDLYQIRDDEVERLHRLETGITKGPIVDFGLVPPGDYRVTITNSLGMKCHHKFRVLPGVPVDRAILCPYHPAWMLHNDSVQVSLELPWPAEWKSLPIVAVYHLEAGRRKLGRWEWLPPQKRQFRSWVVRGALAGPLLEDRICEALPESLFAHPVPPTIKGPDLGTIQLPYGQCQVSAISFLLDRGEKQKPPIYLGSFGFSGEEGLQTPPNFFESESLTMIPRAMPRWELNEKTSTPWEIRLSRQIIQQILARAEQELQKLDSASLDAKPKSTAPHFPFPVTPPIADRLSS